MDLDLDQLARRILRPDRPRLAEARAAVAGITDPAEAWEVLGTRGLNPPASVQDADRRFHDDQGRRFAHPPSLAACVAMASDWCGVERAEALARESLARLTPFGAEPRERLAWSFHPRERWQRGVTPPLLTRGRALGRAAEALAAANGTRPEDAYVGFFRTRFNDPATARAAARRIKQRMPVASVGHLSHMATWWDASRDALGGAPNPFEPLCALLATGCWIERLDAGDAVALVMPTV